MLVVLLAVGVGLLLLVPTGTAVLLLGFPDQAGLIPVWFWLVWLSISLGVAIEGPALADALGPPSRGVHSSMRCAKWAAALGALNVASALAALLFMGSNKPTG